MSRISSLRSSFCCKTEEDYREEIMSLKNQLARMKEESKLLKVKLRISEENVLRKEKIICTMIDPLKAHLSVKSMRDHCKISQENRSITKPVSKDHAQDSCSRAYRNDFRTRSNSNRRIISSASEQRSDRKKKDNLKVITSMECLSPLAYELSELAVLSFNEFDKRVQRICKCQRNVMGRSDKNMSRDLEKKIKGREASKTEITNTRNSVKREEIKISKKIRSNNHGTDTYHQVYSGRESLPSSPFYKLKENKMKTKKDFKMKPDVNESPVYSIICEHSTQSSLNKDPCSASNCSIGKQQLNSGSELVFLCNGQTQKVKEIPQVSEKLSKVDSSGKFGISLIEEGNAQKSLQHIHANSMCRETGDNIYRHTRDRKKSIFQVDIKKKESKKETDYISDMDLYNEIGFNIVVKNVDTQSIENASKLYTEDCSETVCDDDVAMMDQMLDSLKIIEQSLSSNQIETDNLNINTGEDTEKIKEDRDEQSVSYLDTKRLQLPTDEDNKHDYLQASDIRNLLLGKVSSELMLNRRRTI